MKLTILCASMAALAAAFSQNVNAQSGWVTNSPTGDITTNANTDNVGIKTTVPPIWELTLNGHLGFQNDLTSGAFRHVSADSYFGLAMLSTTASGGWNDGSGILLYSNMATSPHTTSNGAIDFVATPTNNSDQAFNFVIGNNSWDSKLYINKLGHVGIGTTNPVWDLTLKGHMGFDADNSSGEYRHISADSYYGLAMLSTTAGGGWTNGSGILLNSNMATSPHGGSNGSIDFVATPTNSSDQAFNFVIGNNSWDSKLYINKFGHVGIGTTSPNWDLTVNGHHLGFATDNSTSAFRHLDGDSHIGLALLSTTNAGGDDGSEILLYSNRGTSPHGSGNGSIDFVAKPDNGSDPAFNFVIGNGGWASKMWINKNGKVGIGTTSPDWDLSVNGHYIGFKTDNSSGAYRHLLGDSHVGLALLSTTNTSGWSDGSGILLNSNRSGSPHGGSNGSIDFVATPDNATDMAFNFVIGNSSWASKMHIDKQGKVVIGNASINGSGYDYKLYVENGILTERVKVAIDGTADWSDYVFADNYDLKSLNEVETFINKNKHLPDVPSAQDVVKNGIDVGKMDATLLQKIEELTLYVIQQQKEINELKNKLK